VGTDGANPNRPKQVAALLQFIPVLEHESFAPGTWQTKPGQVPWFEYCAEVDAFVGALYERGFVLEFDGLDWATEAQAYLDQPGRTRTADFLTLRKVVTVLVRSNRFAEGTLAKAFEQCVILAVLYRLRDLCRTKRCPGMLTLTRRSVFIFACLEVGNRDVALRHPYGDLIRYRVCRTVANPGDAASRRPPADWRCIPGDSGSRLDESRISLPYG